MLNSTTIQAQSNEPEKIKLSGIVLRLDSLTPISSANIYEKHTRLGVRADNMGLFSIEVEKLDTIVFSAVGSKTTYFIVPGDLEGTSYSIIQRMPRDTVFLKTVEITSWPSLDQFNETFTKEFGYDQEYISAYQNSNPSLANMNSGKVAMGADENYRTEGMRYANRYSYVYENAHIPVKNVLNPNRWDKLVKDWKTGKH